MNDQYLPRTLHTDSLKDEYRRIQQAYELLRTDQEEGEAVSINNLQDAAYLLEEAARSLRQKVDDILREDLLNKVRDKQP